MTAIWYDTADDRLVIEGALQTYAPRTLMAVLDGDTVMVRLKVRTANEFGPVSYSEITDANGAGFADATSAKAYLDTVFAMRLAGTPGPRGFGIFTAPGSPDDALGQAGDLYIDAVSGDLFTKET